jgi:hypothetical protein
MARAKQYPKKILARATADELQRVATRAKAADLSVSRFLIECALTVEVANGEDRSQRERALREIRRVGKNLNQVAPRGPTVTAQLVTGKAIDITDWDSWSRLNAQIPDAR